MAKIVFSSLLFLLSHSLFAAAIHDGKPLPEDINERCRLGAIEMVKDRKSSIQHVIREERKQELQSMIEEWEKRLETDEKPCNIYRDIFNAAFAS